MSTSTKVTLEDLRAKRKLTYVDTLYGERMGLRRISTKLAMRLKDRVGPDGQAADPETLNREVLRWSVQDPEPTDEVLEFLEEDGAAFVDLLLKIQALNGFSEDAQRQAARDFRPGDAGPAEAPEGSGDGVPVPPGA